MPVGYGATPPPMGPFGPLGQPLPQAARPEAGQARRRPAHRRRGARRPPGLRWHGRRGPLLGQRHPGRRRRLLDHPARQQRLGAGQAGHRDRARLDRHGIRRLAQRRQHHRHARPRAARRAPASSSTSRATCSPTTTSSPAPRSSPSPWPTAAPTTPRSGAPTPRPTSPSSPSKNAPSDLTPIAHRQLRQDRRRRPGHGRGQPPRPGRHRHHGHRQRPQPPGDHRGREPGAERRLRSTPTRRPSRPARPS